MMKLARGLFLFGLLVSACSPALQTAPPILVESGTDTPVNTLPPTEAAPLATAQPTSAPATDPVVTPTSVPYLTPEWFKGSILYEVYVRSFADSDGDGIGDLSGVTGKLDYIQSLGADSIWLMPVYPSPSEHGYDVSDYFGIHPDFGTRQDLQELVQAAHARDMKIILDFVPSHLSNQNAIFTDAYKNPASIYSDWFVWNNDAHSQYATFAGEQRMPRFNHYNPEVVEYLVGAAIYWLDLDDDGDFSDGVDGFRVDNATFPPQEFLMALRQGVKQVDPEALLLGETWVPRVYDLSIYFTDQFDALFDFPFYELMMGSPTSPNDSLISGKGHPALLTVLLKEEQSTFPAQAIPVRFLNNHDTDRIASEVLGDASRQKLAAALLAALPGPLMLYYGQEIGMPGRKGGPPAWDSYRREPMDWYAAETGELQARWFMPEDGWNKPQDGISVEEQEGDPDSLLNYYRRTMQLRRDTPALHAGSYAPLEIETSGSGTWGIVRQDGEQVVVGLFNFATEARDLVVNQFPLSSATVVDLLTGQTYPLGAPFTITLPPGSAVLLAAAP